MVTNDPIISYGLGILTAPPQHTETEYFNFECVACCGLREHSRARQVTFTKTTAICFSAPYVNVLPPRLTLLVLSHAHLLSVLGLPEICFKMLEYNSL